MVAFRAARATPLLALLIVVTVACAGRHSGSPVPDGAASLGRHRHSVTSLAMSPDGRRLVSGSRDGTLRVWRAPAGGLEAVLSPGWWRLAMWAVAISPDARLVAGGWDDFRVRVWDLERRARTATLEGHTESIRVLAFSPDGRLLASGGRDTTVRLWDVATWRDPRVLRHNDTVRSLAFTPDGRRLFTGTADDTIYAWDVASGRRLGRLRGHGNTVHALAITPDGRTLISGAADRTLRLWSLASSDSSGVLQLDRSAEPASRWERYGIHPGPEVMAVAVGPHGRLVASAHRDSAIRLWDLPGGIELAQLPSPAATTYAVAFSPDGRFLYSGGDDDAIYRWDLRRISSVVP